ncbi:unnamed protein product, partial [Prorocentrum cordatum]
DNEEPDLRGCIDGLQRLPLRSAAELREMNHVAADFYLVPGSAWAFRKSMAAGRRCGDLVKERGKGRLLGPPGIHAGLALMEGIQEIVLPNDFLMLVDDNNVYSQATVAGAIEMCKVSESSEARNKNNRNPNEDELQPWEEGSGNIQIGINETPNFRAAPPKDTNEETMAKLDKLSGDDLKG